MFDLFNIVRDGHASLSSPGSWLSAKRTLQQNLDKIVTYYQTYPQYIDSSHILVRIIYAMNMQRSVDVDRYWMYCKQRAPGVAQSLKLSSSYSKGNMWDGVFYGKGSKEFLLSVDEWFDVYNSDINWKQLQSVKVLCHGKSDLTGMIPDGRTSSVENGLTVLSINIPMLMVQYYHWNKEQDLKRADGFAGETVMQFIYKYALTNMLYTHQDYALFNRMRKLSRGEPVGVSLLRHSFFTASVHGEVDRALLIADTYIRSQQQMDLYSKLLNVPVLCANNFCEVADLPDIPPTLQVYWLLIITRIPVLAYVITSYKNPGSMLAKDLYAIQRLLKTNNVAAAAKASVGAATWKSLEKDYNIISQT